MKFITQFLFIFINLIISLISNAQSISLIAGGGRSTANVVPATSARIDEPFDIILDSNGCIYFTDSRAYVVRRIDTNGYVTTIAGNWMWGNTGDGGQATNAKLKEPNGLVLRGNDLFIADPTDSKIRVVNLATGIINTAFGTGARIDSGDGGIASRAGICSPIKIISNKRGDFYTNGWCPIRKINAIDTIISTICNVHRSCGYNGDSMMAIDAQIYGAWGMQSHGNNLYVCDFLYNNRLRKIDSSGVFTTIAGISVMGTSYYNGDSIKAKNAKIRPVDVELNSIGEIYIADYDNCRLRKIGLNDTIYTIAGTGIKGYSGATGRADTAKLGWCLSVAVDACDNIYIGDRDDTAGRIRKITYPYGNQPTITITQDDTQIPCYSLPVSFTASTRLAGLAPTYQWQVNGVNRGTSSPTFSYLPTHGDVVRCILRSNLYCVINPYDTSNEIHVVVDSLTPPVLTIGGPSTATLSSTVPLSTTIAGGSFSSYTLQWRNSAALVATTTTPSYSYTKGPGTDTFTVTLTSTDRGCYDSATSSIHTVSLPVGINNTASSSNTWVVYPNPAHQKLFIANKQLILGKLTICNALGTEVYTTQSTGHQAVIDISALPVGVYTLQAKGGGEVFVTKFTKE